MKNKRNSFVVFLDIDGVLNTRTTVQRTSKGYIGIDDARVTVLANTIKKYGGGDIVLTSDWKNLREDDNTFDFGDHSNLWERLLLTNGIENAKFASHAPAIEALIFMDYLKLF